MKQYLICVLFWFKGTKIATEEGHFYQCDACKYRSKRRGHLKRHIQEKHGPNERIQCEFCHKIYKHERSFSEHGCFKIMSGKQS